MLWIQATVQQMALINVTLTKICRLQDNQTICKLLQHLKTASEDSEELNALLLLICFQLFTVQLHFFVFSSTILGEEIVC